MSKESISQLLILFSLEVTLILVAFIIYMIFRIAKKSGSTSTIEETKSIEVQSDTNQIIEYVKNEIARSKTTLMELDPNALESVDNLDYLPLNLRISILSLEQEIIQQLPELQDIDVVEKQIIDVLKHFRIIGALSITNDSDGNVDDKYKELIEKQNKTIDFLKKYANEILVKILKQNEEALESVGDSENTEQITESHNDFADQTEKLLKEINNLGSNNTELSQCIAVLEGENEFLRNQIHALIKIDMDSI